MIYLNNSSLEYLGCTRRYVYQVVRGAVVPKEMPLHIGTLFHAYMRDISSGDAAITLAGPLAVNRFAAEKANVPDENIQLVLADLACQARDQIALADDTTNREMWFEFPITVTIDGEPVDVTVAGTSDLRSLEAGHACISDYKTTKKKIDADLLVNYSLKSQLFFYAASMHLLRSLGRVATDKMSDFWDAVKVGAISRRYIYASYTQKKVMVGAPEPISSDTLNQFIRLIDEKAHLAAYLHKYPERSTKDGMTTGGCYWCPFKSICTLHEPRLEARAIDAWYLGFQPYNPKHYDV